MVKPKMAYSMRDSLYLNNLELCIDEVILQDGLSDRQITKKIRSNFRRSIQANIDFHAQMAKHNKIGDPRHHRLMASIYREMLR